MAYGASKVALKRRRRIDPETVDLRCGERSLRFGAGWLVTGSPGSMITQLAIGAFRPTVHAADARAVNSLIQFEDLESVQVLGEFSCRFIAALLAVDPLSVVVANEMPVLARPLTVGAAGVGGEQILSKIENREPIQLLVDRLGRELRRVERGCKRGRPPPTVDPHERCLLLIPVRSVTGATSVASTTSR